MKKFDRILIVLVLVLAGIFFGVNRYKAKVIEENSNTLRAEIYVKGELYKVIPLSDEEQEILIETDLGKNVVKIHDKGAEIVEADCHDHICEKTGFIDKPGDIIVCLPNKVVVEIKGYTEVEIDELSR